MLILQYLYISKDGVWRGCNKEAIEHMKSLKIKDLQYKENEEWIKPEGL